MENVASAIVDFRMVDVWSTRDGAGPYSDHNLWFRDGMKRFLQAKAHVLAHRASYQDPVSVPGRCYKLDAEAAEIPTNRAQYIRICLAGIAAACAYLSQFQ
jgi:hypothetical protein